MTEVSFPGKASSRLRDFYTRTPVVHFNAHPSIDCAAQVCKSEIALHHRVEFSLASKLLPLLFLLSGIVYGSLCLPKDDRCCYTSKKFVQLVANIA